MKKKTIVALATATIAMGAAVQSNAATNELPSVSLGDNATYSKLNAKLQEMLISGTNNSSLEQKFHDEKPNQKFHEEKPND